MEKNSKRALLVIDVQNEYFTGKVPVTYPPGSLRNILRVMDVATSAGVPVVVIQHAALSPKSETFRKGSDGWQLHPEVAQRNCDVVIEKNLPGSFTGTSLEAWLRERGVDTVVICGYMTQMCCDTTARQAVHFGMNVEFLSDATGTLAFSNSAGSVSAEEMHRAILVVQQSRFSKVMSAEEWIKNLAAGANE